MNDEAIDAEPMTAKENIWPVGRRSSSASSRHRVYSGLQLAVWRMMETGEVSLDALRADQEVGRVVSGSTGWAARLERALGTVGSPAT